MSGSPSSPSVLVRLDVAEGGGPGEQDSLSQVGELNTGAERLVVLDRHHRRHIQSQGLNQLGGEPLVGGEPHLGAVLDHVVEDKPQCSEGAVGTISPPGVVRQNEFTRRTVTTFRSTTSMTQILGRRCDVTDCAGAGCGI